MGHFTKQNKANNNNNNDNVGVWNDNKTQRCLGSPQSKLTSFIKLYCVLSEYGSIRVLSKWQLWIKLSSLPVFISFYFQIQILLVCWNIMLYQYFFKFSDQRSNFIDVIFDLSFSPHTSWTFQVLIECSIRYLLCVSKVIYVRMEKRGVE